jgi:hypothetical protein
MATRVKDDMDVKETDYAWAAGFLDGEGAIGIEKTGEPARDGRTSFTGRVIATQGIRAPLDKLKHMFGGTIYTVRNQYGEYWAWRVRGDGTLLCLKSILPYLVLKQRQAELVIAFKATVEVHKTEKGVWYGKVSDEIYAARLTLYEECKALNGRRLHTERLNERGPFLPEEEHAIVWPAGNEQPAEATEMIARLVN